MTYTYPISPDNVRQKKVDLIRVIFSKIRATGLPFDNGEVKMFDKLYDKSISELQDINYKLNSSSML
jgi:hypothetical protein